MDIKIVRRPVGDAPDWVRDAWIGLSLPLAVKRKRRWRGVGVLSGPRHWLSQLWDPVKASKIEGYLVNAKTAVDHLADHRPDAAAWWREHTPLLLNGKRYFVIDADSCERELRPANGVLNADMDHRPPRDDRDATCVASAPLE
ncbi:hypothetical protein U1839_02455 [Sphingomonas sp. RT2P30]|uniref:hypothetical protein n=1 Tax=Parasphingomonas halimpatiens TaxID=3096162 RepID=UPI002FC7A348